MPRAIKVDLAPRHRRVPFLVIDDRCGVSGAQEPAALLQAPERAAAERKD